MSDYIHSFGNERTYLANSDLWKNNSGDIYIFLKDLLGSWSYYRMRKFWGIFTEIKIHLYTVLIICITITPALLLIHTNTYYM